MAQTLSGANAWWARMRPHQLALSTPNDRLTYAEYKDWSDRVAASLIAEGLAPGDRVAICAVNSLAYCALIMGIIRAGGIVSPVNHRYTAREVRELCENTEPRFVFADADHIGVMAQAGFAARSMDAVADLRDGDPVTIAHDVDPEASVVIIATSGSTARPKGVVFTHRTMTAYVSNWALEESATTAGTRVIGLAPLSTSAGFVQLIQYTTQGCTYYMQPRFQAAQTLKFLIDEKIEVLSAVPVFFEAMAALPQFAEADLSAIRLSTCGGARVSRQLLESWRARGVTIRQIYGQTEVGGNATVMPAHLVMDEPDKCGWGGVFVDLRVVRADGTDCDPGEPGEILMRSPAMMKEYWRNPEATRQAIRDGWLHSGDIGMLDEQGMLTFVDRKKDLIISGGLNISAAEVERALCDYAGIDEALVFAAPDSRFGETPFAVYHGPQEVELSALVAHCNSCLSDYKVPRYIVFSSAPLPRLATGKLSKPAVRAHYSRAHETLQKVR